MEVVGGLEVAEVAGGDVDDPALVDAVVVGGVVAAAEAELRAVGQQVAAEVSVGRTGHCQVAVDEGYLVLGNRIEDLGCDVGGCFLVADLLDWVVVDEEEGVVSDEGEGKRSLDGIGIEVHAGVSVPAEGFQDAAGVDAQEDRGKRDCDRQQGLVGLHCCYRITIYLADNRRVLLRWWY